MAGAPGSPFGPCGSWFAARSSARSEPLRMSADVIELSRTSLPESVLFLTFDAVIALKAIFEEVTAW